MLTPQFIGALAYAAIKHATQKRKGSEVPYLAHLLGVASIALERGATEAEAIAALLHDVIEDQGGREVAEELRAMFGAEVCRIVDGCTDADVSPKPPWRARKEAYVHHVRTEADRSILLVSASDKLYNARSLCQDYRLVGEALWQKFSGGRDGSLWYYRAMVDAFRAALPRVGVPDPRLEPLVDELDRTVTELEGLAARRG